MLATPKDFFAEKSPRNPKRSPDGVKMEAQGQKGNPQGPKIGNKDKRENERTPKAEELKNIKK